MRPARTVLAFAAPVAAGYGIYRGSKWVASDDHSDAFKVGRGVGLGAAAYFGLTYIYLGNPGHLGLRHFRVTPTVAERVRTKAIFVKGNSQAVFGNASREIRLDSATYGSYLHEMMDALRHSGKHTLLLRIHGGLNELDDAPERDTAFLGAFERDESTRDVYPILINWQSSLRSTYRAHLRSAIPLSVNDGRFERSAKRVANMVVGVPYELGVDLVRGALNAPYPLGSAIGSNLRYNDNLWHAKEVLSSDGSVRGLLDSSRVMDISGGRTHHAVGRYFTTIENAPATEQFLHWSGNVLDVPLGAVSPILAPVVSTFAQPAWVQMRIRARELFRDGGDAASDAKRQPGAYRPPRGAVGQLMDSLTACFAESPNHGQCRDSTRSDSGIVRVVVTGHSMGAIVATELVHRYRLPYSDVVFMAAASTIHDFESTIVPFLMENTQTRFYNLSLHPTCEDREHYFWISPYGSLLTWLDNFLAAHETAVDGTYGRWRNVVRSAHMIPDTIAPRVFLKAFGHYDPDPRFGVFTTERRSYGSYTPCTHGAFNMAALRAWDRRVWSPGPAGDSATLVTEPENQRVGDRDPTDGPLPTPDSSRQ